MDLTWLTLSILTVRSQKEHTVTLNQIKNNSLTWTKPFYRFTQFMVTVEHKSRGGVLAVQVPACGPLLELYDHLTPNDRDHESNLTKNAGKHVPPTEIVRN